MGMGVWGVEREKDKSFIPKPANPEGSKPIPRVVYRY